MNWRTKFVLQFTKFRKPMGSGGEVDIAKVRKNAVQASKLGALLFDKQVSVASITNTSFNGIPLRIYKNSNATNQRVIIYYHGGGFALYDIESHNNVCKRLCATNNCMVVSVGYSLAPESTFPVAHEDAFEALKWTVNNIETYGGNGQDVVVAGDSAGGNLAACMAHRCKKQGIKLSAQVLIYPWIDGRLNNPSIDRNGTGYLLTKPQLFWFQKQYTPNKADRLLPEVSPCFETDFTGLAPAFILTAQYDPLLDDGYNYYQQLNTAGNKVKYKEYQGLIHGFVSIPLIDPVAMQAFDDIRLFLANV